MHVYVGDLSQAVHEQPLLVDADLIGATGPGNPQILQFVPEPVLLLLEGQLPYFLLA